MPPRHRVAIVLGTRPEAIKLAPVIQRLRERPGRFEPVVITTSQKAELLAQAMAAFRLSSDLDLGLSHLHQTLADFTARALLAFTTAFRELKPDVLLVQGDTSTVIAAALAAFYCGVPVGNIEAGLRSGDSRFPFPEEAHRRMSASVTDLHFAPTSLARENLLRERIPDDQIFVTGNTIVDALAMTHRVGVFASPLLNDLDWGSRQVILATVHRRENLNQNLRDICAAFRLIVEQHPRVEIVIPVHLNPLVRDILHSELHEVAGVRLLEPLAYHEMVELMRRSAIVCTDSGGVQEEATALQKPVLVLRTVTERPEIVDSRFGELVGSDRDLIVDEVGRLLTDPVAYASMTSGENPFGDGRAAERIVDILEERCATGRLFASPYVEAPVPQH